MKHRSLVALGAAALVTLAANGVQAQTYVNPFNGMQQGGGQGQTSATTAYGQYFTSSTGGNLSSLTFSDTDSSSTGTKLVVQAFDTTTMKAIGNVLYSNFGTVAGFGDGSYVNENGGTIDYLYNHSFAISGVSLTAGQAYVAYLVDAPGMDTFNGTTTVGNTYDEDGDQLTDQDGNPVGTIGTGTYGFGLGTTNTAIGGAFVAQNPAFGADGTFTQFRNATPNQSAFFQANYSITITPAATAPVPEVATWAMMIAGFGLAGAALRRRRSVAVSFAA